MWTAEAALDIDAPPERVWALLADVPGWPHWNAGVASATLHGPLASGSHFDMQLPDGGPLLRSTLVDVRPNAGFTDETAFEGVIVRVAHLLAPQPEGGVRVTYRTEVDGPGAAGVGADVSADFPDVLAALKRAAEAPTMEVHCRCGAARLTITPRRWRNCIATATTVAPRTMARTWPLPSIRRPRCSCRRPNWSRAWCKPPAHGLPRVRHGFVFRAGRHGPAQRERLSAAGRPLSAAVSHPMPTCRAAGARHAAALPSVSGRVWRL